MNLRFLSPFQKNPEIEILFNHMIKMAYENATSRKRYIFRTLLETSELKEKFHKDFFTKLLGDVTLNDEGKIAKTKVDQALKTLESKLPQLIENDKNSALDILSRIGGNVFLVSGLEFYLLRVIDEELVKELERNRNDFGYGCGGFYTSYGDNSDSFDQAFDSADSSGGGSGCSGDSGCSGCSGCGGCGGCS